jgi:hypothetical protein
VKRLAVLGAVLLPLLAGCQLSLGGPDPTSSGIPDCSAAATHGQGGSRSGMMLMAQSVRTASLVPCIRSLPVGWRFTKLEVSNARARFWLGYDRSGKQALEISVHPTCDLTDAVESASGHSGVRRFDMIAQAAGQSRYRGDRYFTFAGGCVRYRFDLHGSGAAEQADAVSSGLDFARRADLAKSVHDYSHGHYELDPVVKDGGR